MNKKLTNKNFLLLCQGSIFSTFGAVLYSAAVGYWVYEKTGSTALMGVLSSITYIIQIFAGPIAGSISDHLRRRNVLVATDLIRGIAFTVLGYLAFKEKMSVPMVVIVAVLSGLCSSLFTPASTSLTPDMLDESVIIKGQSIVNGSTAIINLVGTAISGALIVSLGVPLLIIINGVCYIVSGISECFIYDYPSHNEKTDVNFKVIIEDLKDSMTFVRNNTGILKLGLICMFSNFLISGFYHLLLPYVLENGMSTQDYGYLGAFVSAGSLIGTLLLSTVNIYDKKPMRIIAYLIPLMVFTGALGIYLASFKTTAALLLISFFFNGIVNGILNAVMIIILPENRRGVLSSIIMTAVLIGNALSALIYGVLGDLIRLNILGSAGYLLALLIMPLFLAKDVQGIDIKKE
ncbi:MAG: MFS transporter [Erysipelotrichaceae bacterium]|nr:MFS transporter [Erysipelotrichaceae bacterium]